MSKPKKYLRLDKAIDLLHHSDARLMQMHSATDGTCWFILHKQGGAISDKDANAILARPDVRHQHDGLFPGVSQTFRMVR
jgi:hypothetical protein